MADTDDESSVGVAARALGQGGQVVATVCGQSRVVEAGNKLGSCQIEGLPGRAVGTQVRSWIMVHTRVVVKWRLK